MTSPKSVSRTAISAVTADTAVSSLLTVETSGRGFIDLTREVTKFVGDACAREGAVTLFIRHTSASLTIQENADPSVLDDLMTVFDRFAPEDAGWTHDTEGPDDMPAHVKSMRTASSLHIPPPQAQTRARYVAGDLSDRTSPPSASARDRAAVFRRHLTAEQKPAAERSAAGLRMTERLSVDIRSW